MGIEEAQDPSEEEGAPVSDEETPSEAELFLAGLRPRPPNFMADFSAQVGPMLEGPVDSGLQA